MQKGLFPEERICHLPPTPVPISATKQDGQLITTMESIIITTLENRVDQLRVTTTKCRPLLTQFNACTRSTFKTNTIIITTTITMNLV